MKAIELIPHRPPMVFVESLLQRYDNTAIASVELEEKGICNDAGRIQPELFVELIAQTVAMANG
jgi:predicted hotdog family 3-hydroxylacyl-ACP dehydratase